VTGWYARQTTYMLIALAILITFVTGFDSLEIAQSLYAAPAVVSSAAAELATASSAAGGNAAPAARAAQGIFESDDFQRFLHPFLGLIPPIDQTQRALYATNEVRDNVALQIAEADDRSAKNRLRKDRATIETMNPADCGHGRRRRQSANRCKNAECRSEASAVVLALCRAWHRLADNDLRNIARRTILV
jgi:hypothetical protein